MYHLNDGAVAIDNNRAENQIRPWQFGRSDWLLAGSRRSGQSAKINDLNPQT